MLAAIYLVSFVFTIHYALLLYVGSTFIEQAAPGYSPELIYGLVAALTIILVTYTPSLLRSLGQFRATLLVIAAICLSTAGLAIVGIPAWASMSLFVILGALQTVLRYDLDIYVEKYSRNTSTGWTRGVFLTVINTAVALSPLAAGIILETYGFPTLFLIAACIMIGTLIFAAARFKTVPERHYHNAPILITLRRMYRNADVWNITCINFLLQFFYAWMVVYAPLFLFDTMGFSWTDIGLIFTVMLTAFIIFEIPAGWIADKRLGEKELLAAGCALMGLATLAIPFVGSHTLLPWALLFFATRTGAALVEIMTETYFFKKVGADDTDTVSAFRLTTPFSYLVAMPLAGLILTLSDRNYHILFIALGIIMLYGIRHVALINDTK